MFAWHITFFNHILHTSIVDITVWHFGSPNYMLVSSICIPYLYSIPFVSYYYAYLALYTLFYVNFCYIFLPAKFLHIILLQLPFRQVYFAAYPCFLLQFFCQSALSTICFSIVRCFLRVFANNLYLCFKFIKLCSSNSLAIFYGNWKICQMIGKT